MITMVETYTLTIEETCEFLDQVDVSTGQRFSSQLENGEMYVDEDCEGYLEVSEAGDEYQLAVEYVGWFDRLLQSFAFNEPTRRQMMLNGRLPHNYEDALPTRSSSSNTDPATA